MQFELLKKQLKAARKQVNDLENKIKNLSDKYRNFFNKDRVEFLLKGNHRGSEWSNETIDKGLRLYMACGARGYEELLQEHMP